MHKKIWTLFIGAENIAFPPKPKGRTDGQMDISNHKVASLLKMFRIVAKGFNEYKYIYENIWIEKISLLIYILSDRTFIVDNGIVYPIIS